MNDAAGAGVHSRLFLQNAPVGKYLTNYDAEVYVTFSAVTNLQSRLGSFEKAIVFIHSRSAIKTIALQHLSESLIVSKIKQVIRKLINYELQKRRIPMDTITSGHKW
ncbi:hypothetical protein NPIL_295971 [Nephila pilipes]|uniref:Uncharacterized protein n=1 Tax=Nephila pilipes TaxID=299642 RepID=A0A8X6PET7_NEPPI|nr:hypothetical protein NPIL_295971 [Nephila pilipes]